MVGHEGWNHTEILSTNPHTGGSEISKEESSYIKNKGHCIRSTGNPTPHWLSVHSTGLQRYRDVV